MADTRTRREKLEAMANQTASPQEAEIARRLLAEFDAAAPAPPREALAREIDDFLARVTVTYQPNGIRVDYDGAREPGVIGRMLRIALAGERAAKVGEGNRLEDS